MIKQITLKYFILEINSVGKSISLVLNNNIIKISYYIFDMYNNKTAV